jgi:hypothetical protein
VMSSFGGCTFDDKPARIHVLAPITTGDTVGDVNLTDAGLEQVKAATMPSCESQGTPDKGFFTPSYSTQTSKATSKRLRSVFLVASFSSNNPCASEAHGPID